MMMVGGRRCVERAGGRKVLALNLSPPGGRDYGGGGTRVLCVDIGGQCRRRPDVALSLTCSRQFKFIVPAVSSRRAFKSPLVVVSAAACVIFRFRHFLSVSYFPILFIIVIRF